MTTESDETMRKLRPSIRTIFGFKSPEATNVKALSQTPLATTRERRRIRRILKSKPVRRHHASNAPEEVEITEEALSITEDVIEQVLAKPRPNSKGSSEAPFRCLQCGAPVPQDSDRCPKCLVLYLHDVSEEEVNQLERAESKPGFDEIHEDERVNRNSVRMVHLNVESGMMSFIERSGCDWGAETECPKCGTVVEFDTNACPMCGTRLEGVRKDLMNMLSDMEIDSGCAGEINCPLCGERTLPRDGRCQECGERVHCDNPKDVSSKVQPLIRKDKVVFVHLDVTAGEVNYL
ncbi:MAG: zinc ribbon domain-containing protein, partial [Thermoplasmata archaeon]